MQTKTREMNEETWYLHAVVLLVAHIDETTRVARHPHGLLSWPSTFSVLGHCCGTGAGASILSNGTLVVSVLRPVFILISILSASSLLVASIRPVLTGPGLCGVLGLVVVGWCPCCCIPSRCTTI
jgi:hypothetical protein